MCLPSVLVHKMTSYYADFYPRQSVSERSEQQYVTPQNLRAGDTQYHSLSRQFLSQQEQNRSPGEAEKELQELTEEFLSKIEEMGKAKKAQLRSV